MGTNRAIFRRLSLIVFAASLAAMISATGCTKKTKSDEGATPNGPSVDENSMGDSDSGKAMGMTTVHFPYDSFVLTKEAKSDLAKNAAILKDHVAVKIQIEGHCDQRGGIQYNIALGEKRANAVKKYLVDMGIGGNRITTISYGKERPVDTAETEEAYAKNRRANFVITAK